MEIGQRIKETLMCYRTSPSTILITFDDFDNFFLNFSHNLNVNFERFHYVELFVPKIVSLIVRTDGLFLSTTSCYCVVSVVIEIVT